MLAFTLAIAAMVAVFTAATIIVWKLGDLPGYPSTTCHDFDYAECLDDEDDNDEPRPNVVNDGGSVMHSSLFSDHLSSDLDDFPGILVNSATGLFMETGGAIDVGGNPYGTDEFH